MEEACKANMEDVAGFDARSILHLEPEESVGWRHHEKTITHLYPYFTVPLRRPGRFEQCGDHCPYSDLCHARAAMTSHAA